MSALLIFGLSLWAYAISYATIDISPNQKQILKSDKPTISVDWPYAIGASLTKAKVFLDGKDISNDIELHSKGFVYTAPKKLPEGIHVIDARLEYKIIYTKKVNLKWFFSTDTVAPPIIVNERKNVIASRNPNLALKGKTEPLSKLKAVFNNRPPVLLKSDRKGNFLISLTGLKKKNDLLLESKDRAGNITKRKLTAVIDTKPPSIKKISPGHGSLIFTAEGHNLTVDLKDGESGVVKASLKINGQVAKTVFDKKQDKLVHAESFNKDGKYEAEVEAYDVAGNKLTKKWHFEVDTSRIIVDQSDFKLYFYKAGKLRKTLDVAVGMPNYATPNGNWKVIDKQVMPSWRNPHTSWSNSMPHIIPPGASNPLGLRALYLNAPGIRIHGTSAYYSIGRRASHGCIRVRNPEIVQFYPMVKVGTPVLVRP